MRIIDDDIVVAAANVELDPNVIDRKDSAPAIEDYRSYLLFLARLQVNTWLQGRLDPSDVVQETLMKAVRATRDAPEQSNGQSPAQRAAWLRQILANTLKNLAKEHRRAQRDVRRDISLEASLEASSTRLAEVFASVEPSPSQRFSAQELLLRFTGRFETLPEAQQQAVVLQKFEGLPLGETAERMGVSRDTVIGLLRRGLRQLRDALRNEEGQG